MKQKSNRLFDSAPFFVSSRTHFKFLRRCGQWLIRSCEPFAKFILGITQKIPFWNNAITVIDTSFDMMAFGTNRANGKFAQSISFLGYGLMLGLSVAGMILGTAASAPLITSLSVTLGMYFEAVTILNWFDNYKTLEQQRTSGELTDSQAWQNAYTMFHAANITFMGIAIKGLGLALTLVAPTAGIALFLAGFTAEVAAMIGSIGKEAVNINQNVETLINSIDESESEYLNSFSKILNRCPAELSSSPLPKQPNQTMTAGKEPFYPILDKEEMQQPPATLRMVL